jgi:hypothetical protein
MNGENQETKIRDRFDLEQEILECWKVVNDISLFVQQGADAEKFQTLGVYYEQKFARLWDTFETLTHKRKIL